MQNRHRREQVSSSFALTAALMGSWKLTRVLAAEHRPLRSEGRRWVMGMSERVVELGDGLPLSSDGLPLSGRVSTTVLVRASRAMTP